MIKKITATELKENSIASLPSRPSLPSLYSGRSLSAKELREAFDKLPTLLATRFNALIEGLGLYKEGEALECLADALATGLREGHSLSDLFSDIASGALCEYMSADGERTLAEVLTNLSERLDDGIRYAVVEVGDGDIVSSVESIGGDLLIRKNCKSTDFAPKSETDALAESVEEIKADSISKNEMTKTNARLSNVEELLSAQMLAYEEKAVFDRGVSVPQNALSFASLDHLGGCCLLSSGEELLNDTLVHARHTPRDTDTYPGTLTVKNRSITFANGRFEMSAVSILLFDGALSTGRYLLPALSVSDLSYRVSLLKDNTVIEIFEENASLPFTFFITGEKNGARIELILKSESVSGKVTPSLKRQTLVKSPVRHIRTTGKNLVTSDVHDLESWTTRVSTTGSQFKDYEFTSLLPESGKYTISLSVDISFWSGGKILSLYRSVNDGVTWISPEGWSDGYVVTGNTNKLPFTFRCAPNEKWRLTIFPPSREMLDLLADLQIEAGESASPYKPYEETTLPVPEEITALEGYGESLYDLTANYVDFEAGVYRKSVATFDYEEGDENVTIFMTDGVLTVKPISGECVLPLPKTKTDPSLLAVRAGGAVFFDSDGKSTKAYSKTTYQTKTKEGDNA